MGAPVFLAAAAMLLGLSPTLTVKAHAKVLGQVCGKNDCYRFAIEWTERLELRPSGRQVETASE
jgi:hypothetical protein